VTDFFFILQEFKLYFLLARIGFLTLSYFPLFNLFKKPVNVYIKGKAISLQAWAGHKGSRRLRLPDFKTVGT
jgi:hypothetical protein